jgi:hypothetical protein
MAIGYGLLRPFLRSPARGAETSVYVASSPEVEGVTGKYFFNREEAETTPAGQDNDAARRLWEVSETLVASIRPPTST